jgi:hypothetical protein
MNEHTPGASMQSANSMETELLLAAARRHPTPADVSRAHAAMSHDTSIDWNSFVPLARHHGVLPLLHRHLSMHTFDERLIPRASVALMQQEAERSARRSLMLAGELVSLLGELEQAGIRVVPLKGPVLALQLYGSAALRRTNDLDLLVAEEDAERAVVVIAGQGYRTEPSWDSDAVGAMHREVSQHVALRCITKPHRVELHYYVTQPFGRQRFTLATVEDELECISFFGRSVWVMRPEVLLVYLCVHGTKHVWGRIEWIGGIAELLRSGRVADWDRVNASVRRLDAERAFRSGLHLVQELFDVPVPEDELRGDRSARAAAHSVAQRLRNDPAKAPNATTSLVHILLIDSGIRKRIARVWSVLFVATIEERLNYPLPRVLSPLYYLFRPARILARRLARWASSGWHAFARAGHPL